jgi:Histone chaperone domain CHZ
MEEIDTSNILGRRTRGKNIDFAEAAQKAQEAGETLEEDDSDDDEDFVEPEQVDIADKMEE